jgi:hypothetical protein
MILKWKKSDGKNKTTKKKKKVIVFSAQSRKIRRNEEKLRIQ